MMTEKTAVVTGGLGGIGVEVCRALLDHKVHNLCILDVTDDETAINILSAEYPERPPYYIKCDVTNDAELDTAFNTVREKYGSIDIVGNVAGIFDDTDIERTLLINAGGVIKSSLTALKYMSTTNGGKGGVILNVASICGLGPSYMGPIYTASKYAVIGFTRSMAHEFYEKRDGVKFMILCPAVTTTTVFDKSFERLLYPELKEKLIECLATKTLQTPDTIGKTVLQALDSGKNGSVWVTEWGLTREIELVELYTELAVKHR